MKRSLTFLILITTILVLTACNGSEDGEFVTVEKNGKKVKEEVVIKSKYGHITKDDLFDALLETDAGEAVLIDLVTQMILESQYTVTEEDIDAEINFEKERLEADGINFEEALGSQNLTMDVFRENIRLKLLGEALLTDGITVTDEEIESYYHNMTREVDMSHIVVDDEEDAKEIKAKLDAGEDFEKLAKEYSTDTTAAKGGQLGFMEFGTSAGFEFDNAAFALEVGETSDIVESFMGYHIIKSNGERNSEKDIGTLDENREAIKRNISIEKINPEEGQQRMNNIYSDAEVQVFLDNFENLFGDEDETVEE